MSNILDGARDLIEKKTDVADVNREVEKVLKLIAQHTFGCVVAGGYPRDIHFGLKPKDIDICMYNFHPDDYAERVLLDSLFHKLQDYKVINISSLFDDKDEEYIVNDARVYAVWNLPELGVDIILYNDCYQWSDVVNQFDFNLNQFIIPSTSPDNHHRTGEPFTPDMQEDPLFVGSHNYSKLVQIKDNLTPDRVAKIKSKHRSLFPESYPEQPDPLEDIAW